MSFDIALGTEVMGWGEVRIAFFAREYYIHPRLEIL